MDYQTYKTKKDAILEMARMRGWERPRPERRFLPNDENSNSHGYAWVIAVGSRLSPKYLRRDGFVR